MPPSLPTGTVSRPSAGTQTFPAGSDADRERAADDSAGSVSPQVDSPSTTPRPDLPPAGVVSRREHDVALSRAHERVAELEHENDVLRDYIEKQAAERRAVIERYERLLDRQHVTGQAETAADDRSTHTSATPSGLFDTVRTAVRRLRSRLAAVGRD